jgi:hypothetical protein
MYHVHAAINNSCVTVPIACHSLSAPLPLSRIGAALPGHVQSLLLSLLLFTSNHEAFKRLCILNRKVLPAQHNLFPS